MTEPQLSAEMKKRFSAIMLEWIESQWKIEQAYQNGEPYTRMKFEADASKVEDKLQHFLATALEEQRAKVTSEAEDLMSRNYKEVIIPKLLADERKQVLSKAIKIVKEQYYIDVTIAKLNQLKEEGK